MTSPDATTRPRHRIGGYRVIAPIGAGGFATVYRALDETTKTEVAIKVLAENHSLVKDTRRRFVGEVGLLATIDSPAIAKIYEVGETDTGQPYMVLELADRGDLRRRLEEIRSSHRALNRSDLTTLAHHLYDALSTLHDAEIVHRDVSPGNILIRSVRASGKRIPTGEGGVTLLEPGERFLLADLGHAKDLFLASGFTAGGGTKGYASPEQIDDITVVDHRADIFSATAVIEWAAHDTRYAKILEPFFDIGLAEEPDDRFDSMEQWHAAFCAALGANGNRKKAGPMGGLRRRAAKLAHRPSRRSVFVGSVAVFIVMLITLLALTGGSELGFGPTTSEDSQAATTTIGTTSTSEAEPVVEADPPATLLLRVKAVEAENTDSDSPSGLSSNQGDEDAAPETDNDASGEANSTSTTADTATTDPNPAPPESTTVPTPTTTAETAESRPSTSTNPLANPPSAEIVSPRNGTEITSDVVVEGRATYAGGLRQIELIVKNVETGLHWNPFSGEFEVDWLRFALRLDPEGQTEVDWAFAVPADQLAPGTYLIQAWGRGIDGVGEAQGDSVTIVVP